jgi:hypothetical protein
LQHKLIAPAGAAAQRERSRAPERRQAGRGQRLRVKPSRPTCAPGTMLPLVGRELRLEPHAARARPLTAPRRAAPRRASRRRQGTASTLTRSDVRGGGKKPYKQKGTGNARRGSSTSPLFPGGGITFGPKPKDWSIKMNKKERRLALATALQSAAPDMLVVDAISSDGKVRPARCFGAGAACAVHGLGTNAGAQAQAPRMPPLMSKPQRPPRPQRRPPPAAPHPPLRPRRPAAPPPDQVAGAGPGEGGRARGQEGAAGGVHPGRDRAARGPQRREAAHQRGGRAAGGAAGAGRGHGEWLSPGGGG